MSGGMQKIIMNIRGILKKGNIVVFDEPLAGLDAITRVKMIKMIDFQSLEIGKLNEKFKSAHEDSSKHSKFVESKDSEIFNLKKSLISKDEEIETIKKNFLELKQSNEAKCIKLIQDKENEIEQINKNYAEK